MELIYRDSRKWIIRFDRGDEVMRGIAELAETNGIAAATFSALGAARRVLAAWYNPADKKYRDQLIDEPVEIVGLNGNITRLDGVVAVHAHGSFATQNLALRGGHVKELYVSATCEVIVELLSKKISREYNPETGLNLLHPPE